jgi:basic membrane protein A and related proteins
MKKILSLFVLLFAVVALASCEEADKANTFEIAMITDAGEIDDKSFNQGTWEGIVEFAKANKLTHKYYKPIEISDTAYGAAIDLAVAGGAKVIVTPGFLFEPAIYAAQTKHPDVKFILIDGVPHPGDYTTYEVKANTKSILFKEHESGFLAGYAAVKEGFRKLGFMGGIAVPAVVRFGAGFVYGAGIAAQELEVEIDVTKYEYLGTFGPSDAVKTQAAAWFNDGVEIIFVAAGGAGNSVMAAAEEVDKFVIGVDIDQSTQSETVLTSAMKGLATVVKLALTEYVQGTFTGGTTEVLGIVQNAVGLPFETSLFTVFKKADLDAIIVRMKNNEFTIPETTIPAE